jgi:hypothetical protein
MLQNRLKHFGYTNTLVLEGGTTFNELKYIKSKIYWRILIMASLTVSAADEKRVKALGFLRNKGTDNFSGRIITVNGKITAAQNKCIAEAAELFGNGIVTLLPD